VAAGDHWSGGRDADTQDLDGHRRATLAGTVDGASAPAPVGIRFDLNLRVATATGTLRGAEGSVAAVVLWRGDPAKDIRGTLTGQLRRRTPSLTANDTALREGDAGQSRLWFTVRLSAASTRPAVVRFIIADGSARRLSDYAFKQGTLTFAAGETVKKVGVKVNGDTLRERDETLFLVLFQPTNAKIADPVGVGTIRNDD
jgi:chitinase